MAGQDQGARVRMSPVHVTAFVAALAALTGCASNKVGNYTAPSQGTELERARLSTAQIDGTAIKGANTLESFQEDASSYGLPQEHLTEAQLAAAETQARRAAAQAAEVTADANYTEGVANADAFNQAARTDAQISHAGAQRLAEVYDAKLEEMDIRATAAEIGARIEFQRQDELLAAAVKDWQSEVEKLQAQANAEWMSAQAEYNRMGAERESVQTRGQKQIEHMQNVLTRTTERADAKVRALRAESQSVSTQTAARAAEIRQQLSTVRDATGANVSELRQRSDSERTAGIARAAELRARAKAIQEQNVDETFALNISAAENAFTAAQAEAERLFQNAAALEEQLQGEYTRRFSQAAKQADIDRVDFEEAMKSVDSFLEHGKGEVALLRVNADTVERKARAAFIHAESEARANAIYETTRHQRTLAEEEAARIAAEAEAEAARLRAEYFQTLARQQKREQVTVPNSTKDQKPGATSSDKNPEFTEASDKAERIDPAHVAAFKTALAQAVKLRTQADAQEQDLFAQAEEQRSSFNAWYAQRSATNDQAIAEANTYQSQTLAEIQTLRNQAQATLAQATVVLGNAKMEAEAQRRESIAYMTSMLAEAEAIEKKSTATHTQYSAQANAAERTGDSELRSLEVVLDSTLRQGEARVAQLNAEADALSRSQTAIAAQMRQEILAAQEILTSELAKLDQAATSYLEIARAVYDERISEVALLQTVNDATRDELAANNFAQQQVSLAEVGYLRDANLANALIAQAAVERVIANADFELGIASAQDTITRAALLAQNRMDGATVSEQFQIADAEDLRTRANFDARIASTIAGRDRAYAERYLAQTQQNLREQQAVASAAAYAELSSKAIALLNERTRAFDQAAQQNWHSVLAQPNAMPQPYDSNSLNEQAEQVFGLDPIANVTDDENE